MNISTSTMPRPGNELPTLLTNTTRNIHTKLMVRIVIVALNPDFPVISTSRIFITTCIIENTPQNVEAGITNSPMITGFSCVASIIIHICISRYITAPIAIIAAVAFLLRRLFIILPPSLFFSDYNI